VKPHLPFTCPQKYWDLYPADKFGPPADVSPPKNVPAMALHDWYELRTYGRIPATGEIDRETAVGLNRGYRACISFLDAQVGRVLDELDRLKLSDNTIVVLWGDHGYHLGENGIYTKMTNFERGVRVPLIIRVPQQPTAGRGTPAMVELVDLYPTLVELCGLPMPDHLEGTSFAPLIFHFPNWDWKQAVFSEYLRPGKPPYHGRSVREAEQWRYTEWTDPEGKLVGRELYSEVNDPDETINLADDPEHREAVAEMAKILHAGWRAAVPKGD
jgi:arylsulfatase A-like enzyme